MDRYPSDELDRPIPTSTETKTDQQGQNWSVCHYDEESHWGRKRWLKITVQSLITLFVLSVAYIFYAFTAMVWYGAAPSNLTWWVTGYVIIAGSVFWIMLHGKEKMVWSMHRELTVENRLALADQAEDH